MEKKNAEKMTDRSEWAGEFEREWDPERRRVSFNENFTNHYGEQLAFIAGVLDMLFLINFKHTDDCEDMDPDVGYVIMAARESAKALRNSV